MLSIVKGYNSKTSIFSSTVFLSSLFQVMDILFGLKLSEGCISKTSNISFSYKC